MKKQKCKIHKYHRTTIGKNKITVWACAQPDCTHYLYPEMVTGKSSICWTCGEQLFMTKKIMVNVRPHCDNGKCFTRPSVAKHFAEDWDKVIGEETG